jgi:hypothetical protein
LYPQMALTVQLAVLQLSVRIFPSLAAAAAREALQPLTALEALPLVRQQPPCLALLNTLVAQAHRVASVELQAAEQRASKMR